MYVRERKQKRNKVPIDGVDKQISDKEKNRGKLRQETTAKATSLKTGLRVFGKEKIMVKMHVERLY